MPIFPEVHSLASYPGPNKGTWLYTPLCDDIINVPCCVCTSIIIQAGVLAICCCIFQCSQYLPLIPIHLAFDIEINIWKMAVYTALGTPKIDPLPPSLTCIHAHTHREREREREGERGVGGEERCILGAVQDKCAHTTIGEGAKCVAIQLYTV